ncbi:MAG TPA: damage-control phosphatase ARMT1 family protein [Polyangiaceae bacterium]|jgi:hypothetical protein|nr:damage-control phosphatase ARMT1 family protein [Polyangiaceae bacterium]
MHEPSRYPGRIRTDTTNPFAHHTLKVRVPAIVRAVLEREPDYPRDVQAALEALALELETGAALPALTGDAPGASEFRAALAARAGDGWLSTDWLCAETYAYRQLVERSGYFRDGRDPFFSNKREEYASSAHQAALETTLALGGARDARFCELFGAALFGNRIDLSFAASRERGLGTEDGDLLTDEREAALRALFDGSGPVHVIADNAGTELTLDLVLADAVLTELEASVVVHLKTHPTFVSDATPVDVRAFLGVANAGAEPAPQNDALRLRESSPAVSAWAERLRVALANGRLVLTAHPFFTGPESLWSLPPELAARFEGARLVVLKGDANYRRAVGDAVWPVDARFAEVTHAFPAPLLALRTLKSDPIVGVPVARVAELDAADPSWRVNGKRGVASFGGR